MTWRTSSTRFLWSRTRLMKIVKQFNLYPDLRATKTEEEVVEAMRNAIEVREKGGDTFWVAYEGKDPKTVQQVTQRLADTFVEESARDAVERSRATSEFIERESTKAKAELDRAAGDLARFYQEHPELDPRGRPRIRAVAGRRGARHRQGGQERRQAAALRHQGGQPRAARHAGREGPPRGAALARVAAAAARAPSEREQELSEARRELASLRARFSEDYPDVARARAARAAARAAGRGRAQGRRRPTPSRRGCAARSPGSTARSRA